MSTTEELAVVADDPDVEFEIQDEEKQEKPKSDPKLEARARRMGWVPKEEYRGPEDNWRSAEEFIEVGENELPVLKERLRKSDSQVVDLTRKIGDLEATMKEFAEHHSKVEQRAQARAVKELKAEQRKAVEEGDTATFDKIDREIDDLSKEISGGPQGKTKKKDPSPDDDPAYQAWIRDNDWYNDDIDLTVYAEQVAPVIARKTGLEGRAFYDEVAKAVKAKYPDKFTNTRRAKPSTVEGAGDIADERKSGKKTYSDLPPEAKAACDRFVKQGLVTKEQYIKDYEWE